MKQFFILLKKDLLNMTTMRRYWQEKKAACVGMGVLFVFLFGLIVYYEHLFLNLTLSIGLPAVFFILVAFVDYVVAIFSSIKTAPAYLFQCKDYDFLFSMPIKSNIIFAEKVAQLYISDLASTLLFTLPALVLYGVALGSGVGYYLLGILLMLVLPILPSLLGVLIGLIITWISSKFPFTKYINIALYFLFFIGIVFISGFAGGMSSNSEALSGVAASVSNISGNAFLTPVMWFTTGVIEGDLKSAGLLFLVSVVAAVVFYLIFGRLFKQINLALNDSPQKANFKMKEQKSGSQLGALFRRELRFSTVSAQVILNVFLGPIMALIFTLIAFFGLPYLVGDITSDLPADAASNVDLNTEFYGLLRQNSGIVILVILLMFYYFINLLPTSSFSISIEGKSFWITKTLPISVKKIFFSKYAFQFFLVVPILIICVPLLVITLHLGLLEGLLIFVALLVETLFVSKFGLLINLAFPKMDWKQSVDVVKNSAASFVMVLFTIVNVAVVGIAYALCSFNNLFSGNGLMEGSLTFFIGLLVVQGLGCVLLTILLNTKGKKRFEEISG